MSKSVYMCEVIYVFFSVVNVDAEHNSLISLFCSRFHLISRRTAYCKLCGFSLFLNIHIDNNNYVSPENLLWIWYSCMVKSKKLCGWEIYALDVQFRTQFIPINSVCNIIQKRGKNVLWSWSTWVFHMHNFVFKFRQFNEIPEFSFVCIIIITIIIIMLNINLFFFSFFSPLFHTKHTHLYRHLFISKEYPNFLISMNDPGVLVFFLFFFCWNT